jgi:hypothetical protein
MVGEAGARHHEPVRAGPDHALLGAITLQSSHDSRNEGKDWALEAAQQIRRPTREWRMRRLRVAGPRTIILRDVVFAMQAGPTYRYVA